MPSAVSAHAAAVSAAHARLARSPRKLAAPAHAHPAAPPPATRSDGARPKGPANVGHEVVEGARAGEDIAVGAAPLVGEAAIVPTGALKFKRDVCALMRGKMMQLYQLHFMSQDPRIYVQRWPFATQGAR